MAGGRRLGGLIAAGVALALALPGSAPGATTVGQTGNTGSGCAGSGYTLLQDTVAGPPAYIAPTGGVITSWSHDAGPGTFAMRMKAYRPTADADQYSVVGQTAVEQPAPNGLRTFSTRVTVAAGDVLGLSIVSGMGTSACLFVTAIAADHTRQAAGDPSVGSTISGPWNGASSRRVNVAALLEPDEDADGFGDETQDECPIDASKQTDCDPPETTITKGAPNKLDKSKVKFKFESDEPGSTFECKLDKKPYKPCTSARKVKHLDEGKHKFKVRATDAPGNVDPTPAKDKFKVVD